MNAGGEIARLQAELSVVLQGLEHPPLGMGVALSEECGETCRLLLDHHAYGKEMDAAKLGSELADVFVCLCEIASAHDIALEEAIAARLGRLREQAPRWREQLGPALRRARGEGEDPPA